MLIIINIVITINIAYCLWPMSELPLPGQPEVAVYLVDAEGGTCVGDGTLRPFVGEAPQIEKIHYK